MARTYYSERQRLVVLSFATPGDAQRWDEAGQPMSIGLDLELEMKQVEEWRND